MPSISYGPVAVAVCAGPKMQAYREAFSVWTKKIIAGEGSIMPGAGRLERCGKHLDYEKLLGGLLG